MCVVTGANKGIGKAIAKALALTPGHLCIATARSEPRGQAAVAELVLEGVPEESIEFKQLDLDNPESIAAFATWLGETHRSLDVLVNNAAIAFNSTSPEPFSQQARPTIYTNFAQTVLLTDSLVPLLRRDARVVFVASGAGTSAFNACSDDMRARIEHCTRDELFTLSEAFVRRVEGGMPESSAAEWATTAPYDAESGFPPSCYGMSKCFLIRYSQLLAEELRQRGVLVNSMCPGFVDTDMTRGQGIRTPAEGADTAVFLALLPLGAAEPTGGMLRDREKVGWVDGTLEV